MTSPKRSTTLFTQLESRDHQTLHLPFITSSFKMSYFRNFPASEFMTDFEIVEIGNERMRLEAAARKQEEVEAAARQQQEAEHTLKLGTYYST